MTPSIPRTFDSGSGSASRPATSRSRRRSRCLSRLGFRSSAGRWRSRFRRTRPQISPCSHGPVGTRDTSSRFWPVASCSCRPRPFSAAASPAPSSGLAWLFLLPAYATLALGPRRAVRWSLIYLGVIALMVAIDPIARANRPSVPYPVELAGQLVNGVAPLVVVFLMLRYTDIRRRAAEARSEELLTNAIPISIAARLKHGDERIADGYAETTVLFADLVGFTPWAGRTDPEEVVASWTISSADSTRSPQAAAWRRSRRSATRTWRSPARPSRARTMPAPWRMALAMLTPSRIAGSRRPARGADRARERAGGRRRHRRAQFAVRPVGRHREPRLADGVLRRAGPLQVAPSTRELVRRRLLD